MCVRVCDGCMLRYATFFLLLGRLYVSFNESCSCVVVMLRSFMTIRKDARLKPVCHDLPHFAGFDAC